MLMNQVLLYRLISNPYYTNVLKKANSALLSDILFSPVFLATFTITYSG